MKIKEFINLICEEIKYKPIRNDIYNELQSHIEESKEDYIKEGLEEDIAEEKAIQQMGEAKEIGERLDKIHSSKLDWKLILIIITLLGFGILVSFIKTCNTDRGVNYIIKNIGFVGIGFILGIFIYKIDYKKVSKYSNIIYIFTTIIFIVTTFTFNPTINGKIHLRIFNITTAIENILVPLYIISFVGFIYNYNKDRKVVFFNININIDFIKILFLSFISIFVMTLIPSKISAIILTTIYIELITIAIIKKSKNKVKNLSILYGITIIILVISIIHSFPFRIERLTSTFNPEKYESSGGWIPMQQRQILKSSKLIGEADNLSSSLELFDQGNDYALISIIAHYGWLPAIAILTVLSLLTIKIVLNAKKIKEDYGKYLIIGIGNLFILKSIINILMNLTVGIQLSSNLPFISYSGSSLILDIMCIGIILSIYRKKDMILKSELDLL